MKICRTVRGFKKNRESNEEVLKDLNLETPEQMIRKDLAKFMQKIVFSKKPRLMNQLIKMPTWREKGDLLPKYFPRKTKFKRNMINMSIKTYNSLDGNIRILKPKRFKRELKKWILFEIPQNPQEYTRKAIRKMPIDM